MSAGKVVVVTGGSSGIGRAAARLFAERGDRVAVVARGEEALAATAAELREHSPHVLTFSTDVTDADALDRVVDDVERQWGAVDVWVNSAAVVVRGRFRDIAREDFDRVVDVVLRGAVNGTRAALRSMAPRDSGRIVQVGSAVAHHGVPLQSPYAAAKHGVHGFCDALRAELLHDESSVTLSEVNLPAVNTPLYRSAKNLLPQRARPFPPIYQPEDAAHAIVRAADTGARRIDVGSATTAVAWADAVVAGVFERLLAGLGLDLQQTGTAADQPQGDYVHEPLPGDPGTHGEFDEMARRRSYKELLRRHLVPERTVRVADQSRKAVGNALTDIAVRSGLVPRR
jgi:NAD(P)-dependent dehydrogenase (short-subunit alcohol dehydrogenase family)